MGTSHKPAALLVDLAPLTGLRALANAHIVLFHVWWLWRTLLPGGYESLLQLTAGNPILWLVSQGAFGADVFLILSACLAVYHLLPALEGTGSGAAAGNGASSLRSERSVVLGYWRKRVQRILPAYISANLLALLIQNDDRVPPLAAMSKKLCYYNCPAGLWSNALFISNLVPALSTCGLHLWSVLISIHLYAALPLLMCALRPRQPGYRQRLSVALAAAVVLGTVWRYFLAVGSGMHLPLGDVTKLEEVMNIVAMLQTTYMPTQSRIAQAAIGAALGLLLRTPAAVGWLNRRPLLVSATAFALQAACYRSVVALVDMLAPPDTPRLPQSVTGIAAALLINGSPFYSLVIVATLLAVVLRSDPIHSLWARFLGSPAWDTPARLSYSVFLLHELVKYGVSMAASGPLTRLTAHAPFTAFVGFAAATLGGSYAAAWLQWRFVERPFHN